jgi:hypothetical protein
LETLEASLAYKQRTVKPTETLATAVEEGEGGTDWPSLTRSHPNVANQQRIDSYQLDTDEFITVTSKRAKKAQKNARLPNQAIETPLDHPGTTTADKRSFADLTKTAQAPIAKPKRWAPKANLDYLQERPPPQDFHRMYMRLNLSRKAQTDWTRRNLVDFVAKCLAKLECRSLVTDYSLIGKSIVELYIADINLEKFKDKFKNANIQLMTKEEVDNTQPATNRDQDSLRQAVVSRIASLLARCRFQNLRTAICEGWCEDIIDDATAKAKSFFSPAIQAGARQVAPMPMAIETDAVHSNSALGHTANAGALPIEDFMNALPSNE